MVPLTFYGARRDLGVLLDASAMTGRLVLPLGLEPRTSSLPRTCSTTELGQRVGLLLEPVHLDRLGVPVEGWELLGRGGRVLVAAAVVVVGPTRGLGLVPLDRHLAAGRPVGGGGLVVADLGRQRPLDGAVLDPPSDEVAQGASQGQQEDPDGAGVDGDRQDRKSTCLNLSHV